jgi:branched-chain amino acid transport system ATP-binding protein
VDPAVSVLLQVEHLVVRFGGVTALDDASLAVHAGEIHALIGPNGAGKSTLVNCVTAYQRPTSGSVRVNGRPIGSMRPAEVARLGVARTFQTPQLFGRLSTLENVQVARSARGEAAHAAALLDALGLTDRIDSIAADLPYGSQRLLEVARWSVIRRCCSSTSPRRDSQEARSRCLPRCSGGTRARTKRGCCSSNTT